MRWIAYVAVVCLYLGAATSLIAADVVTCTSITAAAREDGLEPTGFIVTRSGSTGALTVQLTITSTASAGTDYLTIPASVVLPAGQTAVTVPLVPLQDATVEAQETVTLTVKTNAAYTVGAPSASTIVIEDDEPATVSLAVSGALTEGGVAGAFTASRTGDRAQSLVIPLLVTGTAAPGVDYLTLPATVTIPAGQSSIVVPHAAVDDQVAEATETVIVNLAPGAGYVLGTASVTSNLLDNEKPVVFTTITDATAGEPTTDTAAFTVQRIGNLATALTVPLTWTGTATKGTDYTTPPTSVALAANVTSAAVTVTPLNDTTVEPSETIVFSLGTASAYALSADLARPTTGTLTLLDDDVGISVGVTDAEASEPGTDKGTFTFTRTGNKTAAVVVNVTFSGTATSFTDYTALLTTITIPANATTATMTVTPKDDAAAEVSESVIATVAAGTGYAPQGSSATVRIFDNETVVPTVTATGVDSVLGEPGDPGLIRLTRTGATTAALSVSLAISGTATSGSDFVALPASVSIPIGSASVDLPVTVLDDSGIEVPETIIVTVSPLLTYRVGGSPVTATVADDDATDVTLTLVDGAASEPGLSAGGGTFQVNRTGTTASTLVVSLAVSGSAVAGEDYVALPVQVVIPSGSASVQIPVVILNDTIAESAESIVLHVIPGTGYTLGGSTVQTVTIADDELPVVSLRATDSSAAEPTDTATITVSITGNTTAALAVPITWTGTATAGVDTNALLTSVTIPVNAALATITVTPINDALAESIENLTATVGGSAAYAIASGMGAATVTIADDDVTVGWTVVRPIAQAGGSPALLLARRTGSTTAALTVPVTVSGTGVAGVDYTTLPTAITFPVGSATFPVAIAALQPGSGGSSVRSISVGLQAGTGYAVIPATMANSSTVNGGSGNSALIYLRPVAQESLTLARAGGGTGSITAATLDLSATVVNSLPSSSRQFTWSVQSSTGAQGMTVVVTPGIPTSARLTVVQAGLYQVIVRCRNTTYGHSSSAVHDIEVKPATTSITVTSNDALAATDSTYVMSSTVNDQFGKSMVPTAVGVWATTHGQIGKDGTWVTGKAAGSAQITYAVDGKVGTLTRAVTLALDAGVGGIVVKGHSGSAGIPVLDGGVRSITVRGPNIQLSKLAGISGTINAVFNGVATPISGPVSLTLEDGLYGLSVPSSRPSASVMQVRVDSRGPLDDADSIRANAGRLVRVSGSGAERPDDFQQAIFLNAMDSSRNDELSANGKGEYRNAAQYACEVLFNRPGDLDQTSIAVSAVTENGASFPLIRTLTLNAQGLLSMSVSGFGALPDSVTYADSTLACLSRNGFYRIRITAKGPLQISSSVDLGWIWKKAARPKMQLAKLIRAGVDGFDANDGQLVLNPGGLSRFGTAPAFATEPGVVACTEIRRLENQEIRPNRILRKLEQTRSQGGVFLPPEETPGFWEFNALLFVPGYSPGPDLRVIEATDIAGNLFAIGGIEDASNPSSELGADEYPIFQMSGKTASFSGAHSWVNNPARIKIPIATTSHDFNFREWTPLCIVGRGNVLPPQDEVCVGGYTFFDFNGYQWRTRVYAPTWGFDIYDSIFQTTQIYMWNDSPYPIGGQYGTTGEALVYQGKSISSLRSRALQYSTDCVSEIASPSGGAWGDFYPSVDVQAPAKSVLMVSPLLSDVHSRWTNAVVSSPASWAGMQYVELAVGVPYVLRTVVPKLNGTRVVSPGMVASYIPPEDPEHPYVKNGSTVRPAYTYEIEPEEDGSAPNGGWLRLYGPSVKQTGATRRPSRLSIDGLLLLESRDLIGGRQRATYGSVFSNVSQESVRESAYSTTNFEDGGVHIYPEYDLNSNIDVPRSYVDRAGFRAINSIRLETEVIGVGQQRIVISGDFNMAGNNTGLFGLKFLRVFEDGSRVVNGGITLNGYSISATDQDRSLVQKLILDVNVPSDSTGLYDIQFSYGSGLEAIGMNRTPPVWIEDPVQWIPKPLTLTKSLAIVSLTPRQITDVGVIQALPGNIIPASTPSPAVVITSAQFIPDATQAAATEKVTGRFVLDGTVSSWACDVTPGALGTIDTASLFLNGQPGSIAQVTLATSKGSGVLPRKYPYLGTFHADVPATVMQGLNQLSLRATDKIYGKTGTAEVTVDVRRDGASDPDVTRPARGGLTHIERPIRATLDLTSVDLTKLAAGTASLPLTTQNRIEVDAPPLADSVKKVGSSTSILRGTRTAITVDPAILSQAKAGTVAKFQAIVDDPTITSQPRNVTFRKVSNGVYVSDVWELQLWAPSGLTGSGPITLTLQRGPGGPTKTATLTKTGSTWASSDASISVTLTVTTDADGAEGLTAVVTCASLEASAVTVQAVRPQAGQPNGGPTGAFTTYEVRGSDIYSNDTEENLGSLRTMDPAIVGGTNPVFNPIAIEVTGPAEIVGRAGFVVPTKMGNRSVYSVNGKWYLATADGLAPESLFLVTKDRITEGGSNGVPDEIPADAGVKNGAAWYIAGFSMGMGSGGVALVTGLGEILYEAEKMKVMPVAAANDFILSMIGGDVGQAASLRNEERWSEIQSKAEIGGGIAKVLAKVHGDQAALAKALLTWDPLEQNRILGEYAMYGEVVSLFMDAKFNQTIDEYNNADDYNKGKMSGRIFFEVALIVAPAIKGAQAVAAAKGLTTAVIATEVCTNIRLSKWFADLPADMQVMVTKVLTRVQVTLGAMKEAKWVAYYAKEAGAMVGSERIFMMALEKRNAGMKPVESLINVEKELRLAGVSLNEKALNAAMMDAFVAEKNVPFYLRSDGSRIPKTAFHYLDSGSARFIPDIQIGVLLGRDPGRALRYSSFESFADAATARRKMQIPLHEDLTPMNNCNLRVEFDTFQNMDSLEVPMEFWGKGDKLEPFAECYTKTKPWGEGGATQVVDRARLVIKRAENIETGEVLYVAP